MVLYEFRTRTGTRIPGYADYPAEEPITYLDGDVLLSNEPEIQVENELIVYNLSDGLYYKTSDRNGKSVVEQTDCVDSIVVDKCKSGLAIYDKVDGLEIHRMPIDSHILLRMKFVTKNNGSIWASVNVLDPQFQIIVDRGYIVYKTGRNNFTNVYIPDAKYPTVVTNGELDNTKIDSVKEPSVSFLSGGPIDYSTRTGESLRTTTYRSVQKSADGTYKSTTVHTKVNIKGYLKAIANNAPVIVQNTAGYPKYTTKKKKFVYKWLMNYGSEKGLKSADYKDLRTHLNLDVRSVKANFTKNATMYNRFKLPNPDDTLSRGFVHVFFTRPDLNILNNGGGSLVTQCKSDAVLKTLWKQKPTLLKQLVRDNGQSHDFMMLLSNKAASFNLSDDGIETETYGRSFGGFGIKFARRRDSEVGGTFDINYVDNRDLDILRLHKVWLDYVVNVYRGKWTPRMSHLNAQELDYASSVYIIITAEDGESIIYCAKYYGVFPVTVPYSSLSWNSGTLLSKPEYSISYNYSYKEDLNPLELTELNINAFKSSKPSSAKYVLSYNPNIGTTGYTWVGAPFVEVINYGSGESDPINGAKSSMKLRFRTT